MSAHPDQPAERTQKAEEEARKKDPHGVAVATDAAQAQPTGLPTGDRHETETTAGA